MVYAEKHHGFWVAYLLPTCVFLLCPIVLWLGRNRYVRTPPTGSVLGNSVRLVKFAGKGKWTSPTALTNANFVSLVFRLHGSRSASSAWIVRR